MDAAAFFTSFIPNLRQKGFVTASLDSLQLDSLSGAAVVYLGASYRFTKLRTAEKDQLLLQSLRWPGQAALPLQQVESWQARILNYLEDHGHPFGKVFLDSISIEGEEMAAVLHIDSGPEYKIDSIRIYGDARVDNEFLQRYLGISNGSLYNRARLQNVSKKLAELQYLREDRPSDLTLLGTGSVLNLYLKARRSSQVNALIGFLPNSGAEAEEKKFLLTVDANILLRNALGAGETFGLVWQQLQRQSPRLNILFDQPYIFKSPFGLNFTFDMYKRDSTFLNINMNLGTTYRFEERQSSTLFIQKRQTIVNGVNTNAILSSRRLPAEADVNSINLGVGYQFNSTDYRFNPRSGSEVSIVASAGNKKIKKNSQVLDLKDPTDPGYDFEKLYDTVKLKAYQFRVTAGIAKYLPLGGQTLIRLAANGGIYQSENYFRNELFQIGGFRLLRGFDEESQFVSQYGIGTVEFRVRTQLNSYFFAFVDGGWGRHQLEAVKNHNYISSGLGLSLETKAGVINMALALGKRDDTEFNLRQPKVHIGFISYF